MRREGGWRWRWLGCPYPTSNLVINTGAPGTVLGTQQAFPVCFFLRPSRIASSSTLPLSLTPVAQYSGSLPCCTHSCQPSPPLLPSILIVNLRPIRQAVASHSAQPLHPRFNAKITCCATATTSQPHPPQLLHLGQRANILLQRCRANQRRNLQHLRHWERSSASPMPGREPQSMR